MRLRTILLCMVLVLSLAIPSSSWAACSSVTIEILQELTLERVAFDARMVITNNIPDKDLTDVRVDVTIKDADGNTKNDIFFKRVSSMNNISSVEGSGIVRSATSSEVHWLIIPSPGAGGFNPSGLAYWVGATLTYTVDGKQEVVSVNPARITVRPEAQLILDYFIPYQVLGDNPFTPQVEAPVPFPLAVRVVNSGFGAARNLKIDSAQPKIVTNDQGLLVDFRLLGASVNDSAVMPSLTVSIGNLESKKIATAYWEMISTLSGRFVEFKATFSHASDLGGDLTSILTQTNTYYFVHRVKVNIPGRDNHLDILADTDRDPEHLPDAIFESEIPGNTGSVADSRSPVKTVSVISVPVRPTALQPSVELKIATGDSGWVFARLADPAKGLLKIVDVVRADGIHLDPNNFWVEEGLDKDYQRIFTFNILDYRGNGSVAGTYTLVYSRPAEDLVQPSTSLIFSGPSKGSNPVYITPETKILFNPSDNAGGSGVDYIMKRLVGRDANFEPAYPLNIDIPGAVSLEYYSADRAGNKEVAKTTDLYVDNAAPQILTFNANPSVIMPQAPGGISAARSMNFVVKASDDINTMDATIDISRGSTFSETSIVKTFTQTITSGTEVRISWDGKDKNAQQLASGIYSARIKVSDGLNGGTVSHTSTKEAQVTLAEWFKGEPLDHNLSGPQQYPKVSGTRIVWQDKRNGNWDIYTKDAAGGASMALTTNAADQIRPSISGNTAVWQDMRNGNWDIYGYDLSSGTEFVICADPGDQELPVISGDWVSWQDNRAGNWDIYLYNIATSEKIRVTTHERDQMHPAISGNTLTWEDYRHGLGDIYKYDTISRTETRQTIDMDNQTLPSISGSTVVWTDRRTGQRDIFYTTPAVSETRVTYGRGDHSQASVLNDMVVYTDYESGPDDPNLSFFNIRTGAGGRLTSDPAHQEEPALGNGMVTWQDDREGVYQIYWANFQVEEMPIQAEIRTGFNLIAVGDRLVGDYPQASDLVAQNPQGLGITKVVTYNALNGIFAESTPDNDFILSKGMAIGVYATSAGVLDLGNSGENAQYTLLPGTNYAGLLSVPFGFTSYDLLASIGTDNARSVRRFNSQTGLWETAALKDTPSGKVPVGVNFVIRQGDGLIITMEKRVDGWKP